MRPFADSTGDSIRRLTLATAGVAGVLALFGFAPPQRQVHRQAVASDNSGGLDPAAWGSDHVGRPVPEFVTGDECLFCHRDDIGTSWSENHHASTLRMAAAAPAAIAALKQSPATREIASDVQFVLGRNNRVRVLKRLPGYGQLGILSTAWIPPQGKRPARLDDPQQPHWQEETFGSSCAGCHATGVDTQTRSFSAMSIDCFACHGDASLDHTTDSSIMHLAVKRRDPPRVVISICGQCHVRSGRSKSSGLPYANNFVAGDNLWRDFQVDLSDEELARLNPGDRHVLENVRDVTIRGETNITCLSCHAVHGSSSRKHRRLAQREICLNCHFADRPKSKQKNYRVHSSVCEY